jgi:prophage DNA circulation protein
MADWDDLFASSYAGQPLHLLDTDDDLSRNLARHRYPRKDGANTEDLGQGARETACTIVWTGPGHLQRLAAFVRLVQRARPESFVHPLTGSYIARVQDLRFVARASERDWVVMTATFVEHSTDIAVLDPVQSGNVSAGLEEVQVAGAALDAAVAEFLAGQETDAASSALATVQRWHDEADLAATRIALELGSLSSRINTEMARLELATNPNAYPVYEAFLNLHRSASRAADAAIARTPELVEHVVTVGAPLLAICQGLYGGEAAVEAFERVLKLNELRRPAFVPAGTRLVIERPEA